jgi:uncharacterized membrane protein
MHSALWIAIAIIGWGTWSLFEKLAINNMSPLTVQLCSAYVYSIFGPIIYLTMKGTNTPIVWSGWGIIWTTCASAAATVAGYAFLFAIRDKPVNEVIAWTQTYPALSFFLCWLVLGETFSWIKIIGIVLLIAGIIIMNR